MKNVIMMLWGMGIASAWWGLGLGLEFYHNGVPKEAGGLALALWFTVVVFSLVTAVYSLFKMVSCIHRSWND